MIRSIAKFFIQYLYDSGSIASKSDRLPRWLRRWVNFDPQLRDFELELLRLEGALVSQAEKHSMHVLESRNELAGVVRVNSFPSRAFLRSPVALAALAASLACVLLVGKWLVFRSSPGDVGFEVVENIEQVKEENAKVSARERWIRSTLNVTKRLASKLNEKGNEAKGSLAIASRTLNQESELVKSAGLEGLRFVAQKLPAATVRMVGLGDSNRN